jgi:hypothetical protein
MDVLAFATELYSRIPPLVDEVVDGLDADQLRWAPGPDANPIGWLVWHLARVQDHHLSELRGVEQRWPAWADRFERPADLDDVGYGHSTAQVRAFLPPPVDALLGYHADAHDHAAVLLADLGERDLDRVVDRRWDPPVTLGVRLVSVADDCLQHLGQAAYVRGLLPL